MFKLGDMIEHAFYDMGILLIVGFEDCFYKVIYLTGADDGKKAYLSKGSAAVGYIKLGNIFEGGSKGNDSSNAAGL